jgi:hypothetical protein
LLTAAAVDDMFGCDEPVRVALTIQAMEESVDPAHQIFVTGFRRVPMRMERK